MANIDTRATMFLLIAGTISFQSLSSERAFAQAVAGSTNAKVGNATAYPISNYANNPLSIVDPGVASETRHMRRPGSTGIGGSYLGTESVTSETAKATTPVYQPVLRNPATTQTSSYEYYVSPQISPALRSVTDSTHLFNSSTTPSFEQSSYSVSNTGLDALPSFNRNTIIQGYSHGGRSWIGP